MWKQKQCEVFHALILIIRQDKTTSFADGGASTSLSVSLHTNHDYTYDLLPNLVSSVL